MLPIQQLFALIRHLWTVRKALKGHVWRRASLFSSSNAAIKTQSPLSAVSVLEIWFFFSPLYSHAMILKRDTETRGTAFLVVPECTYLPLQTPQDGRRVAGQPARGHCWRSEIFWMTCCTTSRPRAQLSASSVYRFTGTQNASFFSSVTRQVPITAAAPMMSRSKTLRSSEKSREHQERLVWGTPPETLTFFLSAGRRSTGLFYWYGITLRVHLVI